jgi:phosphoglycerate dehydrogenase-like enzyme
MNFRVGELTGRRVGIIGCGHIGRRLLDLLEPFRTVNAVYDPFLPPVVADIYDLHVVDLENLFATSDVIVCTLPLTPATQGLLGARLFSLMRPDTVFVNVSRGKVVDTDALVARLERGDVWASLDVVEPENPVPVDHPLRSMSNVFLTPHIAGVTSACGPRFVTLMADEIGRHLAGEATRFDLVSRAEVSGVSTQPRP